MPNRLNAADDGKQPVLPPAGSVICFGFLTYLLLLIVESFPSQNAGASISKAVDSLGDDAAIVACTLSRWKISATLFSSSVGNDYYGERVIEQLRASGLAAGQQIKPGQRTPLEVGIVDASGSRTYFQLREPHVISSLAMPSAAQLSGARMLYVDWYDGPGILGAMERARSQAVPVFLNLESRYRDHPKLPDLLRYTNFCQISLDEPGATGEATDIARTLIDRGVDTVLVTMGAEGCAVARSGQAFSIRPPNVEVIDGYGAGAAFSAGVIYGFLQGWPLERTAQFATAHAGLKCGVIGNTSIPIRRIQRAANNLEIRTSVV